jgi:hypothetical protein
LPRLSLLELVFEFTALRKKENDKAYGYDIKEELIYVRLFFI